MNKASALSVPDYRTYFIAAIFGTMAIWMTRFLFAWLIWKHTESALWVGLASAGLLLPSLIVTPIFGVLSDRINLKTGIISWQLSQGIITAITSITLSLNSISVPLMMILIIIFGFVASAGSPLRLTILPKLVGKTRLSSAVGYGSILFNSSRIIAPALCAWSLTWVSELHLFWFCTFSFVAAAAINLKLPNAKQPTDKPKALAWHKEFIVGLKVSWRSPFIRMLILLTLISSQTSRTILELLPAYSGSISAGNASDLAILTGSAGVGSILGGVFMSRQKNEVGRLKNILLISLILSTLFILALLISKSLLMGAASIGAISLLMTLFGTGSQIILQLQADDDTRGRVMSLWLTIAIAGPAIGAFIMGWITEVTSFNTTFLIMAALTVICCFLLIGHKRNQASL